MVNERFTADNTHLALATGDDAGGGSGLTAWRNGDAAFISGELQPTDQFIGGSPGHPKPITKEVGSLQAEYISDRIESGRRRGNFSLEFSLQTAQFCWWLWQACSTTENTPAGYNTHAITLNASQTPIWHGFHLERETPSKNIVRRVDTMGFLPKSLDIVCNPDQFSAIQTLGVDYSFYKPSASEIAPQTKRPGETIGSIKKNWSHLVAGGLGENQTAFSYNNTNVAVAIKGVTIRLTRKNMFGIPDQNNYPAAGFMQAAKFVFELDVEPYDSASLVDIFALNDIKKTDLAGDIDFDFKFEAQATNDYIRFNADKLNLLPFDELAIKREEWFEGYTIILEPLDTTSSLAITGVDSVNNNGFENP
ncbi:hypothetical protein LCGC14_0531460 [marine sediment metagenome]|uniref:Uncharacterized protein n=1 Tax=marine sediment metagenome TaxID=412755 RepID=A0A0F9RVM1_9ZZZZ